METPLERVIRLFVYSHTGERVTLGFPRQGLAVIRSSASVGSTVLAIFWIRVLQHGANYPSTVYPYRKLYDKRGSHELVLQAGDVTISVLMKTGELHIAGIHAVDWLVDRLPRVMAAYTSDDVMSDPQPLTSLFSVEEEKHLRMECNLIKQRYANWPKSALEAEPGSILAVVADGLTPDERLAKSSTNKLEVGAATAIPDLLTVDTLQRELENLQNGAVISGSHIHQLWRSLLNHWFADNTYSVYIITPKIDTACLKDICQLFLNKRLTANLDVLAVPLSFDHISIGHLRREALQQLSPKEQIVVEQLVYDRMVFPRQQFDCKLVAGIKNGQATVLVTSASFTKKDFTSSSSHTALHLSIPEASFKEKFLCPVFPLKPLYMVNGRSLLAS